MLMMRMRKKSINASLLIMSLVLVIVNSVDPSCATTGPSGCLSCTDPTNSIIYNTVTGNYTCASAANCISVNNNSQCTQCQINYFLFNNACYSKNIPNCANYSVDASSNTQCSSCTETFMNVASNCTVNASYCTTYNYTMNVCAACPANKTIDASLKYCVASISNCLNVSYNGCLQCDQQYVISTIDSTCQFSSQVNYQVSSTIATCLQVSYYFDATTATCLKSASNITSCKQQTGSNCTTCIDGYFLSSNTSCLSCSQQIPHCITCLSCVNSTICKATCTNCLPTHFLYLQSTTQSQVCRQCSIYGCKKCQSINNTVSCLQCERGQTLYNNTCYTCLINTELNLTTLQCQNCPLNCAYCSIGVCTWCVQNYAIDPNQANNSLKCKLFSSFSTSITPITITQILSKQFPNQQELIYNDSIKLMSQCLQQATKFTCVCSSSALLMSSMCYSLTNISTFNLTSVFGQTINSSIYLQNSQTLRLMAQLTTFDGLTLNVQSTVASPVYFPENKVAALLQIYTQILRRQSTLTKTASTQENEDGQFSRIKSRLLLTTNDTLNQLFSMVSSSFSSTFNPTHTTVIYGNGYYMKYYPKGTNITDTDSSFLTVSGQNTSDLLFVFVWFDQLNSSTSLTGNIYTYSPLPSYSLTLSIQQTRFPLTSFSYLFYQNSQLQDSTQVTKPFTNTLLFPILTSTTNSTPLGYNVNYQQAAATDINSLYSSQRIQFIFYQAAFIYVLVFLIAYLILIPCCSLVDFMPTSAQGHRRKRVRSQDLSVSEDAKHNHKQDQQSSQQTIQITVNYKDFFPLYNICNTPRPRRILKLCLFLLNTQHSITFLTLIYFNLEPNHPVIAVVLGLPAYFCTVIMGYIFGCLTLALPGWSKYFINLFVIGYWILWVALMPRFKSQEYQPYVYIFAIVFFMIDLIIDLLEMFMVYFTIKQSERQMKMFQCLAAWLSKRGYYEYDKLARELNDV